MLHVVVPDLERALKAYKWFHHIQMRNVAKNAFLWMLYSVSAYGGLVPLFLAFAAPALGFAEALDLATGFGLASFSLVGSSASFRDLGLFGCRNQQPLAVRNNRSVLPT